MKTLKTIVLALAMLASTLAAQAGEVRGYFRSNGAYVAPHYRSSYGSVGRTSGYNSGYVYRNPYAAYPSVNVRGYYRSSGTYVWPHVRTAPNSTVTDNLSYRGYGTIRMPKYSPALVVRPDLSPRPRLKRSQACAGAFAAFCRCHDGANRSLPSSSGRFFDCQSPYAA